MSLENIQFYVCYGGVIINLLEIKKMKVFLLIVSGLVIHVNSVFAWGNKGHKIVAQIAKECLDKSIVDSVQNYLGDISFEAASVWMDEIRSDHSYDYLKPAHYINVEKDKTYVKVSDTNIINELDRVFAELQHRKGSSKESTRLNLLILFHLVGDLHQPLHTGYADDKGGNTIEVDFMASKSNLHKVWDTNIIEAQNVTTENCLLIVKSFSDKEKKRIETVDFVKWMNDSRILLNNVYNLTGTTIDQKYVSDNVVIIQKQLAVAGMRLASALNHAFGKESKSKPVHN